MAGGHGAAAGLRVVVADANHLTRWGLARALAEAGADVIAEASDTDAALRAVATQSPQVLVTTLDLPGSGPGHIVAIARDRWPDLGVLALSDTQSDESLLAALELGASAYLPKTASPDRIATAAAQAAAAPGAFLAEDLIGARRRMSSPGPRLTARESEVLRLAGDGLTVRAISTRLFISEATTRSHLAGIYRKLGVTSRSQAVLAAERLGMLR